MRSPQSQGDLIRQALRNGALLFINFEELDYFWIGHLQDTGDEGSGDGFPYGDEHGAGKGFGDGFYDGEGYGTGEGNTLNSGNGFSGHPLHPKAYKD